MSKLDGRHKVGEYTLVFNVNTLCDLEEELGVEDVNEVLEVFNSLGAAPSMRKVRTLLFAALRQEQADMTETKAGQIVSDLGLEASIEALMEAVTLAFPEVDQSDEGNAKAKSGAG